MVRITETILRDAHQSLAATRMRTEDMLPIVAKLDEVGFYSLEAWGGATFDTCIRYLNEDPWERLRKIKAAAKKTPIQMLLRGQNLVGYRHYSDDVVDKFVEAAHKNGVDIFRVFDALNDIRNISTALRACRCAGRPAFRYADKLRREILVADALIALYRQHASHGLPHYQFRVERPRFFQGL